MISCLGCFLFKTSVLGENIFRRNGISNFIDESKARKQNKISILSSFKKNLAPYRPRVGYYAAERLLFTANANNDLDDETLSTTIIDIELPYIVSLEEEQNQKKLEYLYFEILSRTYYVNILSVEFFGWIPIEKNAKYVDDDELEYTLVFLLVKGNLKNNNAIEPQNLSFKKAIISATESQFYEILDGMLLMFGAYSNNAIKDITEHPSFVPTLSLSQKDITELPSVSPPQEVATPRAGGHFAVVKTKFDMTNLLFIALFLTLYAIIVILYIYLKRKWNDNEKLENELIIVRREQSASRNQASKDAVESKELAKAYEFDEFSIP